MSEDTKNLLKSCAENLLDAVSCLENRSQDHSRPSAEQQLPTPSNQESTPSVSEEHRRLFGYRPPSSSRAASSSSRGSSANRTQFAPKRRVVTTSTGGRIAIPVRNTWTRTFVCLYKRNTTTTPTAIEKVNMAMAGLEEKSICFSKGGNSDHVHQKIFEAFPLLADAGGYEIFRTGERGNRQLVLISIPPGGYTVTYLKATINTAKGYIRPLQKDLELNSTGTAEHGQMQIPVSPKVSCVNCQVPMDLMRKHQETCSGGSSGAYSSCCSDSDVEELEQSADASIFPTTEEINHLSEMFPLKSRDSLKAYLQVEGSFSKAVTTLLSENTVAEDDDDLMMSCFEPLENCSDTRDLTSELLKLQTNFSQGQREKLKIDEEDVMNDAMAYYKDQYFDPRKKLRIVYKGQTAADTGGVVRQLYTQLLSVIADTFFQGDTYRSPVYNCDMVASGVMKLVGIIIVHSILQGGPGVVIKGSDK